MPNEADAKVALNRVISLARVQFYKPIQIAEILYRYRIGEIKDLIDLSSYRNPSKRWRDEISSRLIGKVSTSSMRYQDDLFNDTALPPLLINELGKVNEKGAIEVYIYNAMKKRLSAVSQISEYLKQSDEDSFSLLDLISMFEKPGLTTSIDRIFEVASYVIFSTIARELGGKITIEIDEETNLDLPIQYFNKHILGIDHGNTKSVHAATFFRAGLTNSADSGLDIWSNFGPVIQVKHIDLTLIALEKILNEIRADQIIIICKSISTDVKQVLQQSPERFINVMGIITQQLLHEWYVYCLNAQNRDQLGKKLLSNLVKEFDLEFQNNGEIDAFIKERGYE